MNISVLGRTLSMVNNQYRRKPKWLKGDVLKKNLSLAEQSFALINHFPQFKEEFTEGKVTWIGTLQPQLISRVYTVKIEYEKNGFPKVWVIDPSLERYNKQPIPHMYNQERLCLYYPPAKEWKRSKWIYQTIIPWICLWLRHYEIWLITGRWMGGGIGHHSPSESVEEEKKHYEE